MTQEIVGITFHAMNVIVYFSFAGGNWWLNSQSFLIEAVVFHLQHNYYVLKTKRILEDILFAS